MPGTAEQKRKKTDTVQLRKDRESTKEKDSKVTEEKKQNTKEKISKDHRREK